MPATLAHHSRFHIISLIVAAVAAIATFCTSAAMLLSPAMFLGWIAFGLAGSIRGGFANLTVFLAGLILGIGTQLAITGLAPALGTVAAPLAVGGVVVLVLSLRSFAPFNNPLAYFLGLTSFFYSGLAPEASAFVLLGAAGVIGGIACAIAGTLEARVKRTAGLDASPQPLN